MDKKRNLTVITPVFNEEAVIGRFYERTANVLDGLSDRFEARLLFIVDRSSDNTLAIIKAIAAGDPRVQVIALSSRFGHQMSLLAGIDHATDADAIVMMDSDLQHPPELIPRLIERYDAGNDIVFTVRRRGNTGVIRRGLNQAFYRLLNSLSEATINANAADFRLISRRVGDLLRSEIRERNMFLRGLFSWMGFNQASIEYDEGDRPGGESKYSVSRLVALGTAGMLSFSTKPLKISIAIGFACALSGFLFGLFAIYEYFSTRALPGGWTSTVTLLLLFSGIQLIFLGIVGAYIGGIYEEVKQRPHYIVDERINVGERRYTSRPEDRGIAGPRAAGRVAP